MVKNLKAGFTVLMLFTAFAVSAVETSSEARINRLVSYSQNGDGDVVFRLEKPSANCNGYWIAKSDAGFNANMSILVSAYHTDAKVIAYGYTDNKWPGSNDSWCKLYAIELNKG